MFNDQELNTQHSIPPDAARKYDCGESPIAWSISTCGYAYLQTQRRLLQRRRRGRGAAGGALALAIAIAAGDHERIDEILFVPPVPDYSACSHLQPPALQVTKLALCRELKVGCAYETTGARCDRSAITKQSTEDGLWWQAG